MVATPAPEHASALRSWRWSTVLLCLLGLVGSPAIARPYETHRSEGVTTRLGAARLPDVLLEWGPAEAAYLSGADTDDGSSSEDDVVLRFSQRYRMAKDHEASILAFFDPDSLIIRGFVVRFARPVAASEAMARFGPAEREIRQDLVLINDELEGRLRGCHSPHGRFRFLLYSSLGLIVELDEGGEIAALRFSEAILRGRESYPDCPAQD